MKYSTSRKVSVDLICDYTAAETFLIGVAQKARKDLQNQSLKLSGSVVISIGREMGDFSNNLNTIKMDFTVYKVPRILNPKYKFIPDETK